MPNKPSIDHPVSLTEARGYDLSEMIFERIEDEIPITVDIKEFRVANPGMMLHHARVFAHDRYEEGDKWNSATWLRVSEFIRDLAIANDVYTRTSQEYWNKRLKGKDDAR